MLAFLPAPGGRAKRLLWALMGGYGLFLHAALVHQHHLWAETSTTTTGASSDTSNTGGITALMSRALLRRETAGQPPGVAAPPRPQYEAQAFFPPLPAAKDDEARIPARRRPENTTEAEAAAGAAAMATEQPPPPPITSPASEFWRAEEARIRAGPGYAAKVDAGSARPLRSVGEMGRAQACFRKGEGYAYLMHMRKAGGGFVCLLIGVVCVT